MSKTTKVKPTGSEVRINGQTKASTRTVGGKTITNYNMSDSEKAVYDYAQNALKDNISKVNVFSPEVQKDMQSQINAYTQQGIDTINNNYTPMINSLKSDIAARFGNLDNSSFMNKLNSIEQSRAGAQKALAQDIIAKRNSLVSDELQKRYNYLNFVNSVQNQITTNAMNHVNSALKSAGKATVNSSSSNYENMQNYLEMAGIIATSILA